jgi:hypothetical protein
MVALVWEKLLEGQSPSGATLQNNIMNPTAFGDYE